MIIFLQFHLVKKVYFRTGNEVDSIRVKYGDSWGENHGGGGGDVHIFELNPTAKIIIVQGRYGSRWVNLSTLKFPAKIQANSFKFPV